jgi:HK97 gp10 family phage protein
MALRSGPKMKLHGAKELEAALRQLPKRIGRAAIRRALMKAAQPIVNDAKGRAAATKPGLGEKGISISATMSRRQKRGRRKDKNAVEIFIGAHSAGRGLAHLIEFGTGPRYQKNGRYTGQTPAQPFMRPAWDAGKMPAWSQLQKLLWAEIEKAARSLARRRAKAAQR